MNIIFMGTPELAAGCLKSLISAGHTISGVFTQPDKPKGRSSKLIFSPVKNVALENDFEVLQPVRLRKSNESIEFIKNVNPDVIVVAAYGQILPQEILEIPKYGCINVHASLLPKYRGAAPINWCIINGEEKTGITIMQMDAGLDTGDMLLQKEIEIEQMDNADTLTEKMMNLGAELIVEVLSNIEKGNIIPIKQNDMDSTYAPMLDKELAYIDFSRDVIELHNLVRGISVWPTAVCKLNDKRVKIFATDYTTDIKVEKFGEVIEITKEYIGISCKNGMLKVLEIQLEGKKRMKAYDFVQGTRLKVGDVFEVIERNCL